MPAGSAQSKILGAQSRARCAQRTEHFPEMELKVTVKAVPKRSTLLRSGDSPDHITAALCLHSSWHGLACIFPDKVSHVWRQSRFKRAGVGTEDSPKPGLCSVQVSPNALLGY